MMNVFGEFAAGDTGRRVSRHNVVAEVRVALHPAVLKIASADSPVLHEHEGELRNFYGNAAYRKPSREFPDEIDMRPYKICRRRRQPASLTVAAEEPRLSVDNIFYPHLAVFVTGIVTFDGALHLRVVLRGATFSNKPFTAASRLPMETPFLHVERDAFVSGFEFNGKDNRCRSVSVPHEQGGADVLPSCINTGLHRLDDMCRRLVKELKNERTQGKQPGFAFFDK